MYFGLEELNEKVLNSHMTMVTILQQKKKTKCKINFFIIVYIIKRIKRRINIL